MDRNEIKKQDARFVANTYARFDAVVKEGHGARLVDENGNEYIDCSSGIGVNLFGVCDEEWRRAVTEQLDKVQHVCNLYYSEPQVNLASMLCERTGADKVFFCNSGAEANECAIKLARKYGSVRYGRDEIITLRNSFHGRTVTTLSATGQEEFHEFFGPFTDGFKYAEPSEDGICSAYTDKTCAVMVETVQGEGGVVNIDPDFLRWLEKFCKTRDILLMVDEVQTGNGRCGYLYSYMAYDLHPDVVTTAKALGGGLPIGACMMFGRCSETFGRGDHGSTFGGNPLACAGACSVISRLTDDFLLEVQGKAAYFRANLAHIKNVREVTGLGLMIGLVCDGDAHDIAERCLEKGLLVLTAHGRIRLLPPLNITKEQINAALQILDEVIGQ